MDVNYKYNKFDSCIITYALKLEKTWTPPNENLPHDNLIFLKKYIFLTFYLCDKEEGSIVVSCSLPTTNRCY